MKTETEMQSNPFAQGCKEEVRTKLRLESEKMVFSDLGVKGDMTQLLALSTRLSPRFYLLPVPWRTAACDSNSSLSVSVKGNHRHRYDR
uniref:Uncharacterized protein n=1 Tax=Salix viminalis TaxID=40686 RepID=A0A6N2LT62_SALVM